VVLVDVQERVLCDQQRQSPEDEQVDQAFPRHRVWLSVFALWEQETERDTTRRPTNARQRKQKRHEKSEKERG
jgi:hypothetical protein